MSAKSDTSNYTIDKDYYTKPRFHHMHLNTTRLSRPGIWSEVPLVRQRRVPRKLSVRIVSIHALTQHRVAPPGDASVLILHTEEDDDGTKRHRARQASRKHVIVLLPPRRLVALEVVHEEDAEVQTGREVSQIEWGPEQHAVEDEAGVHVAEVGDWREEEEVERCE